MEYASEPECVNVDIAAAIGRKSPGPGNIVWRSDTLGIDDAE
jgi:hypothetical protein